jgi:hypothetical protein
VRAHAIFQRGETISLALDHVQTDGPVTAVSALIKRARNGRVPPKEEPAAGAFTVTARAANGAIPAGWDLVIAAGLPEAGLYVTDVKMTVAGGTYVTEALFIEIAESVTPA